MERFAYRRTKLERAIETPGGKPLWNVKLI